MDESKQTTPSLEDNLDVIYGALYLPRLTAYLENLIISYVDAYYNVLSSCNSTPSPKEEDVRLLQLLSGPINQIYDPNNTRFANGEQYPAVNIIVNKINEYNDLNASNQKGNIRSLMKPNTPPTYDGNNMGFSDLLFLLGFIIISAVFLVYIAMLLLK